MERNTEERNTEPALSVELSVEELLELFDATLETEILVYINELCDPNVGVEKIVEDVLEWALCYSHCLTKKTAILFMRALSIKMVLAADDADAQDARDTGSIFYIAKCTLSRSTQRLLRLMPSKSLLGDKTPTDYLIYTVKEATQCFEEENKAIYKELFEKTIRACSEEYSKAVSDLRTAIHEILSQGGQ